MKKFIEFLKNNKWTISIVLTILNLVLNQIDLSLNWTNLINIIIIVLTVLQERVDEINIERKKEIEQKQLQGKGFIDVHVDLSVFTMIWEFIKSIPDDLKRENWDKEAGNIPSHLLIGSSFPLILTPLQPPLIFLYSVLSLSAAFVAVLIEMAQKKWFDGTISNFDIRMTWYGYFIPGLLFYHLLQWIGPHPQASFISGLMLIVIAIIAREKK